MLQTQQIEELICMVAALDRETLIGKFSAYRASFPIDFTTEFLDTEPLDRLRHIFIAMCLHCQRLPETATSTAA
jgi:hypothetical protein